MTDFIKLTQITGRKVENDEKTATGVKPIYVRPWDIESFSQDEDGVTVVKFNNNECIHVAQTPEQIYKMVSRKEYQEPYIEPQGGWWGTDWWKDHQITTWATTSDFLVKNSPYYTATIVYTNGDIWE